MSWMLRIGMTYMTMDQHRETCSTKHQERSIDGTGLIDVFAPRLFIISHTKLARHEGFPRTLFEAVCVIAKSGRVRRRTATLIPSALLVIFDF